MRQRLQQAVTVATWSERKLFRRLARKVDGELPGIEAFVLDDTGFPKERLSLAGSAAPVLGNARASGQLPSCGELAPRWRGRQCVHRDGSVSPRTLGERSEATGEGRCSRRRRVQDQAPDRFAAA